MLKSEDGTVEMTLDVLTDDDGVIDSGLLFFGYWRDLEENDSEPFALAYDGKMDWGHSHVSTFPIRGERIAQGLRVHYRGYKNSAALARGEIHYENDFVVESYINHAGNEPGGSAVLNINVTS